MRITGPIVVRCDKQTYVGIRIMVTMSGLGAAIPQLLDEAEAWMTERRVVAAGAPLLRYHAIDMDAELDIAIGFPVTQVVHGDGRIVAEAIPAGRYASLIYTGADNGVAGNRALIDWIAGQGLRMDCRDDGGADRFAGRFEVLLDGPDDDPDPATWRTEVAIRIADADGARDPDRSP